MTLSFPILRSVSLFVLLVAATASQANLLVNGSFETPANGNYGLYPAIPGWTATTGQIETGRAGPNYGVTGQDGVYALELDSTENSTVQQAFDLSVPTALLVSFRYAARGGTSPETNAFDVLLNGAVVQSFVPTSSAMQTFSFYAAGLVGTNTISFVATGTSDSNGGIVDAVDVSTVPGPVAALPFALIALRRRKRA